MSEIMRLVKVVVMTVGVVFIATPIFSSLRAQELNSQSQVLLTLQTLQQEIAELRDQVDRQNFEIRKLKQSLAQQNASVPSAQQPYLAQPSAIEQRPNSYTDSDTSSVPNTAPPSYQGANSPVQVPNQQAVPPVSTQLPQSTEQSRGASTAGSLPQDDFYNPYQASDDVSAGSVVSAREYQSQGRSSVSNDYPPVIDRSIGAPQQSVVITSDNGNVNTLVPSQSVPTNAGVPTRSPVASQSPNSTQTSAVSPSTQAGGSSVVVIPPSQGQVINTPQVLANPNGVNQATSSQDQGAGLNQLPADQTSVPPVVQTVSESDYYSQGFELLKNSKYQEASDVFNKQLAEYPSGAQADDAHYWISEAMTMVNNTDVAKTHLNKIVSDFPQSSRIPDAKLRLAYIELRKGNDIEARILLQEIVTAFPQSNAAIAAKNRLAAIN